MLRYDASMNMARGDNSSMLKDKRVLLEKIEALEETIEVMQDKELMKVFRESVKALQNGETVAWEDAKRELLSSC